ncbi:hypothetical protein H257_06594 [Aphanomyces astaci]|uniref:HTH psq-type domain-containing protein n=1 Tax=Aphanomyces astaci TaxID=112090 RepID=W4GMY0_APHAT|nr:hypothetical protein H257_06594 [Aphanomyces astaci]ETV80253.1 hypothetical protein H257_06594 [Aphanomyces astaci]|eukprot:XP_009830177.1 hypothetical protein H257_06594 [Aphanomyces astaci]
MERNRNDGIPTATKVAILLALHDAAVDQMAWTLRSALTRQINSLNAVTNVGLEYRQSVRSVAFHANVSKSTLHRRVQEGVLDF